MSYINTEEEAAVYARASMAAASAPTLAMASAPAPPVKLWGISSRQDIMQMRNLMQMKSFHGPKFRR
ncbi:MAG: hypothetical protein HC887_01215 [Desulfobacteraceae bacterium]|nr:hypothetical protein [Desulfobacteraceae bacterium]